MMRAVTAVVLGLATLWCLVVIAFLWAVFAKGDVIALAAAAAFAAFVAAMWFSYSRRWYVVGWVLALVPIAFTIVILSTLQLRMF